LWKHPEVLGKLRAELDIVLGTEVGSDSAQLREKPQLLQEVPYTTAVIKETLRMRGISGTTREITANTVVVVDGESVLIEPGAIIFINNYILMKNPRVSPGPCRVEVNIQKKTLTLSFYLVLGPRCREIPP
jgi:cytochrome P450